MIQVKLRPSDIEYTARLLLDDPSGALAVKYINQNGGLYTQRQKDDLFFIAEDQAYNTGYTMNNKEIRYGKR